MRILYTYDRGIARIFQGGGGVTVCHTQGTQYITLMQNKFQQWAF